MRIDFYLLNEAAPEALWLTACRLLEKAYLKKHQVFVYCAHQQDAEHLDELLWTFKPDSFIPHHIQGEGPEPPPPIQIGYSQEPRGFNDILFNLSPDEAAKTISRDHFREYRKKGFEPQTHNITQKA